MKKAVFFLDIVYDTQYYVYNTNVREMIRCLA